MRARARRVGARRVALARAAIAMTMMASAAAVDAPPHVVDAVMDTLMTADLSPEGGAAAVAARNDAAGVGGLPGARGANKRKAGSGAGAGLGAGASSGPLTAASNKPPAMDVFRMRQAKQARTDNAEFQ